MDKKLFQAVTLTLIFFLLYTFIGKKYFPQEKTIKDLNTSTENITNTQENLEISVLPEYIEENIEQDLPNHIFGNLYVTYSPKGGYINSIAINDEDNILPFKNIGLIPDEKEKDFSVKIEHNRLIFNNSNNEKKIFIFDDNIVTVIISPENKSQIILVSNHLSSKMIEQRYQEIFYHKDNQIKRIQPKKVKETSYQNVKFIGARERYYCFSLLEGDYNLDLKRNKDAVYFYLDSQVKQFSFYIGPQTEKKLKQFNLQGIMHYGFFHSIGVLMVKILYFFHSFTKNWGISLIIFSFFIYSILLPFTMKSTNAMKQMQQIQPLMNELKEKYKDNPTKLQKETMELYKKHKINPLGGCLPMFFQLPIFIALYQVLFRLYELKGAHFLWIKDLSLPDKLFALPFKIPLIGSSHFNLLPIIVMIIGLLQQKITSSNTASKDQKSMGLFFAVFIGFIFYNFPSSLVLYWFVQNLLTLIYHTRKAKIKAI